jgi:hypothetical protein
MNLHNLAFLFASSLFACGTSSPTPGPGDAANDATSEASSDAPADSPVEDVHDGGPADARNDGQGEASTQSCTCKDCVCASSTSPWCGQSFASSDCLQGNCCVLPADAGPPYYDDAGSCPGSCSSPDDIGCTNWFRSTVCAGGDLCCVPGTDAGDAGSGD